MPIREFDKDPFGEGNHAASLSSPKSVPAQKKQHASGRKHAEVINERESYNEEDLSIIEPMQFQRELGRMGISVPKKSQNLITDATNEQHGQNSVTSQCFSGEGNRYASDVETPFWRQEEFDIQRLSDGQDADSLYSDQVDVRRSYQDETSFLFP